MLTHGAMWGCGMISCVVCINYKFCDIREKNVTTRSEIWTTNIRSLGFRDIRECVTLRSLGCTFLPTTPRNTIQIHNNMESIFYFMEYFQSHKTLLWIWIMLWHIAYDMKQIY